jgi:hypothetical protein
LTWPPPFTQLVLLGHVLAHSDRPGVVGGRRREPDKLVLLQVELVRLLPGLVRILPQRVGIHREEESGIAGVFGIDVDLARDQGRAHDLGVAELNLAHHVEAFVAQQKHDHIAQEGAFGVDLRADSHLLGGIRRGGDDRR